MSASSEIDPYITMATFDFCTYLFIVSSFITTSEGKNDQITRRIREEKTFAGKH